MASATSSAGYEIRVRGVLSDALLTAFDGLAATNVDGDTILRGRLPDRVALHGVLHRIDCLGLELLTLKRQA